MDCETTDLEHRSRYVLGQPNGTARLPRTCTYLLRMKYGARLQHGMCSLCKDLTKLKHLACATYITSTIWHLSINKTFDKQKQPNPRQQLNCPILLGYILASAHHACLHLGPWLQTNWQNKQCLGLTKVSISPKRTGN